MVVSYPIDWQFLETKGNSPGKKITSYTIESSALRPGQPLWKVSLNGTFCLLPGLTPSVEDTQSICSAGVSTRASSLGPQEVSDTGDIILFQSGKPSRFLLEFQDPPLPGKMDSG